jgi:hypothetical protein
MKRIFDHNGFRRIEFKEDFWPSSILILEISSLSQIHQSIINMEHLINQFPNSTSQFNLIIQELTFIDLERILYRSSVALL